MYDELTLQKLYESGNNDPTLKARIDAVVTKDRVLDGAPEKYTPVCRGIDAEPFGAYMQFRRLYEQLKVMRTDIAEDYIVQVDNDSIKCEYTCYIALRTLMECGITKSAAKAKACRDVFLSIVNARNVDGITRETTASVLQYGGDYYVNEIIHAVTDSMFSSEEQVVLALKSALGKEYSDDIIDLLGNPKDTEELEKCIRSSYKRACAAQDFRIRKHLGRTVNAVRYLQEVKKNGNDTSKSSYST